jgi:hypothetical protein
MASTSSEPTGKLHDFVVGAFGHGDEVPLADLLARCSHLDAYKQFETEVQELERASSSGKRPADDMNRRRTRLRMRMWRALRSPAAPMVSDGLPEPTEPSAAAPPAPPPAAPSSTLRQGMRVRIIGLTEAADLMNLNGVVACLGPWNAERGRWQVAHGTRTLLLREIKLRPVEDEEPAVASAAEVAQLREAERLAEAERRAAAAQAAAAAAAARAMVDAATATTRDAAVQAAVAAKARSIQSFITSPISPIGYFNSHDRLLEYYDPLNLDPPPFDYYASTVDHALEGKCAAWHDQTSAFCCVGVMQACSRGDARLDRLPHNVTASPELPQRALSHLVKVTATSMHALPRISVYVGRQCGLCARMLLSLGCPLSIVASAEFARVAARASEHHADGVPLAELHLGLAGMYRFPLEFD